MANVEQVMAMLDPDRCAEVYELPNTMARESFRLGQDRVENFNELIDIAASYVLHHMSATIAPMTDPPMDHVRGMTWNMLEHHYRGGAEAAYKAASRGFNGGLSGVLDAIRDYYMKDQEEKYFDFVLMEGCDVMDWGDRTELMRQYLTRYGRFLDGDNMASAEYLATKYKEVIKAHADIVRNVRMQYGR